jgi:DNA-binding NarL/FixJ family response regulator
MKVLIADNVDAVRYGLAAFLEEQMQVEVMGEAANFEELVKLLLLGCPDMLLMSWELPGQNGETLLNSVRLICPETYIVVLSSQIEVASRALELGADNFISKAEPPQRLLEMVRKISKDSSYSSFR